MSLLSDASRMALLDPAFHICLNEAIHTTELVEQFDRLFGFSLARPRAPIERMVDRATGYEEDSFAAFVEFVRRDVYERLPPEVLEEIRDKLRAALAETHE